MCGLERTLFIIKPDAVGRNHLGEILAVVEKAGLRIIGMRMVKLSSSKAGDFYHVHRGKDFFDKLVDYMSSGRCVVVALEGEEAIGRLRRVCGATDPAAAAPGTIRAVFGINVTMNSVHASDSSQSAAEELRFFFPELI
jgi:nucleoside-diphosphate kinase